jgi:hypothetical protein
VRGDRALDDDVQTLVIPGATLDAFEVQALAGWVRDGGHLIWHGPDPVNWGHEYVGLFGAKPVDYRAVRTAEVHLFDETWTLDTYGRAMRVQVVPAGATVLARDQDGLPVALVNEVGQGSVTYALPVVEASIARVADDRAARERWVRWYAAMVGDE